MRATIQIPETQEELDNADKSLYGWDLVIDKKPYDVYFIGGFNHSIGGTVGENAYYCCPHKEKITIDNMLLFCGKHAPKWEIRWAPSLYHKNKWGESRIEYRGIWSIYRNDELFLDGGGRDIGYGLAKAQTTLVELQEHPIGFHFRNWKDEVIGRKVWYKNQPGVVKSIIMHGQLAVMIMPDGIDKFEQLNQYKSDGLPEDDFDSNEVKTSMLDPQLYWYRD